MPNQNQDPIVPTGHPVVDVLAIAANLVVRLAGSAVRLASYGAYCLLLVLLVAGIVCPLTGYKLDVNLWGVHLFLGRNQ